MTPRSLAELADAGEIDPGWAAALAPAQDTISALGDFLRAEAAAGRGYLPAGPNVLRAFRTPFESVRVLIVGQDPYPTIGHPIGLAFAVEPHVRPVPRSLANIYRELRDDVGVEPPAHGDLSAWGSQGVLLLNRVLTVQPGASGSHRGKGWEAVTELAIRALVARGRPLVSILWGKDAGTVAPLLGSTPAITSVHPSPLSASRGFFGSRPFSRVNALLEEQGERPVDWALPPATAGN
ncbi:uracil-DNA glycosylase [Planctomonas deserti]|uniref:uracil-DNA glycosylase n=1 Tax=Planctomonas deserti TaxID=2144185 RepID=UPI000D357AB3|nr:uracil-DNA glycosylase [Planctomonas deserti]